MLKRFFSPKSEAALSDRFPGVALCMCVCVSFPLSSTKKKKSAKEIHSSSRGGGQRRPRVQATGLPVNSRRSRLRCFKTRSHYCLCSARITSPSARKGFPSLTELRTPHAALNIVAAPPAANGSEGEGTEGAVPERRVGLRRQVIGGSQFTGGASVFFQKSHFIVVYNKGNGACVGQPRLETRSGQV